MGFVSLQAHGPEFVRRQLVGAGGFPALCECAPGGDEILSCPLPCRRHAVDNIELGRLGRLSLNWVPSRQISDMLRFGDEAWAHFRPGFHLREARAICCRGQFQLLGS